MKYTLFIVLILGFLNASAQQKQFSLDDNGKYIYYEVVDAKLLSKDSLVQRADLFVNKLYAKTIKQQSKTDTSFLAKGKIVIDKTILVVGHPSGEVNYNLTVEVRAGKYRFWFTDFEFIPYQRDRYGNFVASTPIGTPLEKSPGKLNAGEWKDINASAYTKIAKIAEDLKKTMATGVTEKPKKKTETISTKKW